MSGTSLQLRDFPFQLLLAQAESLDVKRIIWTSLALVGLLVAGLVIVSHLKRRLGQDDAPVSAGFTLSDLRQMHKSGQMTDEEFEKAKAMVVGAAKRAAERAEARKAGVAKGANPDPGDPLPPPHV